MATYSGASKATSQQWILVATCGATLALGVVIGLGAGRLSGQGHTTHPAAAAVAPVQRAPQPAVASTQRPGASRYLVSSADEASVMRQAATALGAPLGPQDGFVVVNADDDLAAVAQEVAAENAILASTSLPPITLRDLRPAQRSSSTTRTTAQTAASAVVATTMTPAAQQQPATTLLLLAANDEAAALHQRLDDAARDAGLSASATAYVYMVVQPTTTAGEVLTAFAFQNLLGVTPIQVLDLRRVTASAPAVDRSSASSSGVIAGQLPGSLDQELLLRLRIEEGQRAITRALAGDVLPNFSAAAQAAIEQGQQAISRAMAGEAPLDSR